MRSGTVASEFGAGSWSHLTSPLLTLTPSHHALQPIHSHRSSNLTTSGSVIATHQFTDRCCSRKRGCEPESPTRPCGSPLRLDPVTGLRQHGACSCTASSWQPHTTRNTHYTPSCTVRCIHRITFMHTHAHRLPVLTAHCFCLPSTESTRPSRLAPRRAKNARGFCT